MSNDAKATYSFGQVANDTERARFLVQSILARASTSKPVMIMKVTNEGGVSPIGRVTIRPLVQQLTGEGIAVDHGDIANVPYLRIQGGKNAVILDPEVGDIGIALFCDQDISVVKSTGAAATPGSGRTNHMADAIYLQSIIAAAPTQYIQFTASGITVHSPSHVQIEAPLISAIGNVSVSTGATGSFTTPTGNVVTVQDGIVTNIY